jgi:hypothetical protein
LQWRNWLAETGRIENNPARGLIAERVGGWTKKIVHIAKKRRRGNGKTSREYLPSEEREDYVAYARRRGCALITARQKNRYVDEFIRFCSSHSGHSDVKDTNKMDFLKYCKWLESGCRTYARVKQKFNGQFSGSIADGERAHQKEPGSRPDCEQVESVTEKRGRRKTLPTLTAEQSISAMLEPKVFERIGGNWDWKYSEAAAVVLLRFSHPGRGPCTERSVSFSVGVAADPSRK